MVKIKLTAFDNKGQGIFIGIVEDEELMNYLNGVAYDEITRFDMDSPFGSTEIKYRKFPGGPLDTVPAEKDFWRASKRGTGRQVLGWDIEEGRYLIAIMNQDGSRGMDFRGSIGVKIPMMSGLGIGLAIGGFIVLLFSFLLVYLAISRASISEE